MSTVSPERLVLPRFCQLCGHDLIERMIESERIPRFVCEGCGFVHYMNPRVVSAVIVEFEGRIVLQQRAMEPRAGYWTFPGGFLEIGESTEDGAVREAREEVGLDVMLTGLHGVYTRKHVGIVLVVYRGVAASGDAVVGDRESTAVRWFAPADIPWDDLAFDSTVAALREWIARRDA
jgi:ADP-ribose pyrophosphatase YjhB (NUDIX family)